MAKGGGRGGGRGGGSDSAGGRKGGGGASRNLTFTEAAALKKISKKEAKHVARKAERKTEKVVKKALKKHGVKVKYETSESDSVDSSDSDSSSNSDSSDDAKRKKQKKKKRAYKERKKSKLDELKSELANSKKELAKLNEDNENLQEKAKEYAEVDKGIREQVAKADQGQPQEGTTGSDPVVMVSLDAWERIKQDAKARSNPPSPQKAYGIFAKFCAKPAASPSEVSTESESTLALASMFDAKLEIADQKQALSEGISIGDDAERAMGVWAKEIVAFHTIEPAGLKALQDVKKKWLPRNQAVLPDTTVKAMLRALCSRGVPIFPEELGGIEVTHL